MASSNVDRTPHTAIRNNVVRPKMILVITRCLIILSLCTAIRSQESASAPATQQVRLTGRVITWDGQPVVGAAIRYEVAKVNLTAELLRTPHAVSDADGRFSLMVKPPEPKADQRPELFVAQKGMAAVRRNIVWSSRAAATAASDEDSQNNENAWYAAMDVQPWIAPEAARKPFEYAEETKVGNLVITTGNRLFGRVRDVAGKPLAKVRVVATDMLEKNEGLSGGEQLGFFCTAETNASGIFDLPCTLPLGASLVFEADGYFAELREPVAAGTPLEVSMRAGGSIQGRVLDADGRSIDQATVLVLYELTRGMTSQSRELRTGPDGSFRDNLVHPGRWRITAHKHVEGHSTSIAHSAVFSGPRENLELIVKTEKHEEQQQQLPVRVVEKKTGKPIATFKVAATWDDYANHDANYLDYILRWQLNSCKPGKDGEGKVPAPGEGNSQTGTLRAIAPGFAPATRKEVEWKEPEAGQQPEPILLEMEPEATLAGIVRDAATKAPVAGARVYAQAHRELNQGGFNAGSASLGDWVQTAADGSFHLKGLGEGTWDVTVLDPKRPRGPATEVTLGAAEQKADVSITVPAGATVAGKVLGTTIGNGTRVFLAPIPAQTFGQNHGFYNYYGTNQAAPSRTSKVAADGSFRLGGVSLDNHLLVLQIPSRPRLGGDLYVPLEPFRVRAAGIQRDFDCSEDRPGAIRGKLTFPHATVPFEQVVVIAQVLSEEGQVFFSPYQTNYPGPRSFVSATGEFEVHVGPGNYQLSVVDLATQMLLHHETKKIEVLTGAEAVRDLSMDLARIDVELAPAHDVKEPATVDRIEIRVATKAMKEAGIQIGDNDEWDSGRGVLVPFGATRLSLVLPLGDARFLCRNNASNLRLDDQRGNASLLGHAELEISTGQGAKTSCKIELGATPEIPEPDAKEKDGENGGADADAGKK